MKKGLKSNGTNTEKNTVREKENQSNMRTGKDFKKMTLTDISSKNNSKTLTKEKLMEKKKSNSIKPLKFTKQNTASDLIRKNINLNSNKKIDLSKKNEKTDIKRNTANKNIHTVTITNTNLLIKQQSFKKDSFRNFKNLRVNSSNPNFGSPLLNNTYRKKTAMDRSKNKDERNKKEDEETDHLFTDLNRGSPKKNTLNNNIFNIDELPSKMSSSYIIKTQEIYPKLINNTFNKEKNKNLERSKNKTKTTKQIKTLINRNTQLTNNKENLKSKRPKSEHKIKFENKLELMNTKAKNKLENPLIKSYKTLDKRPLSGIKKIDDHSINNIVNEASTSTEGSMFRGKLDDYSFGKELGKGAYAIVKHAAHKGLNKKFAIKIYEKFKLLDPIRKNSVKREIEILKKIDHSAIVKLHEVIDTPKQILLVMELVNGVSLLTYLKSKPNRRLEESEAKQIFRQVLEGVNYLHSKNIFHRDIKLENLIVSENNNVKIIDFGFATISHKSKFLNFFCGTPSYMPPEIVQKKDYLGPSADIWSCGILLYTILCGSFPFRALNEKELFVKISKGMYTFPDHLSQESKNLIKRILEVNSSLRPTVETVLSDMWFRVESLGSSSVLKESKEIKLD